MKNDLYTTTHTDTSLGKVIQEATAVNTSEEVAYNILEDLLCLQEDIEYLRGKLEAIKLHQEMIGGSLAQQGVIWHLANSALEGEQHD